MFSKLKQIFSIAQCPECKRKIGTHLKYKCSIHNKEQEQSLWDYINGKLPVCDEGGTKHFTDSVIHCTDSQDGLLEFLLGNYEKNKFHLDCNIDFPEAVLNPNCEVRRICLAGATQAGKTIFKARLKETLLKTFAPAENITVPPLKFEFKSDGLPEMLPSRTAAIGDMNIAPEYVAFNMCGKNYLLLIYDIAGEDLSDDKIKLKWRRSISIIDNVFIFLDPVSLVNNIPDSVGELTSAKKTYNQIISLVSFILQYSRNQTLKHKFAFILSKIDKTFVQEKLKECNDKIKLNSPKVFLLWDNDSPLYPDYSDVLYNPDNFNSEQVIKSFIEQYSDYNYTKIFDPDDKDSSVDVSKDIRYFALSAFGLDCSISDNNIEVKLGDPFRLLDPIMWIL